MTPEQVDEQTISHHSLFLALRLSRDHLALSADGRHAAADGKPDACSNASLSTASCWYEYRRHTTGKNTNEQHDSRPVSASSQSSWEHVCSPRKVSAGWCKNLEVSWESVAQLQTVRSSHRKVQQRKVQPARCTRQSVSGVFAV